MGSHRRNRWQMRSAKFAEHRRQSAEQCAAERATRTPQEQLAVLDSRLGVGVGAAKERARLQAQIEGKKN